MLAYKADPLRTITRPAHSRKVFHWERRPLGVPCRKPFSTWLLDPYLTFNFSVKIVHEICNPGARGGVCFSLFGTDPEKFTLQT